MSTRELGLDLPRGMMNATPHAVPMTGSAAHASRTLVREALLVFALVGVGYALFVPGPFAPGSAGDDGSYLALGAALASGDGYHTIWVPGDPPQLKYPPGLPALLSILWLAFGSLTAVFQKALLLNVLAAAGAAALLWWLARDRFQLGRVTTLALVLSPFWLDGVMNLYAVTLSEPYFILGWASALFATVHLGARSGKDRRSIAPALALGGILGATALFRSQAIFLLPAFLAALVVRRTSKGVVLAAAIAGAAPILLWLAFQAGRQLTGPASLLPDETSYWAWAGMGDFAGFLGIAWSNGVYYWRALAPNLAPVPALGRIAIGLVALAAAAGAMSAFRRSPELALSLVAMLAVVLLWPTAHERFVLGLAPVIGLAAATYVARLGRLAPPAAVHVGRVVAALAFVGLLVQQARFRETYSEAAHRKAEMLHYPPSYTHTYASDFILEASRELHSHQVPGDSADTVLTPWPAGIYLLTGKETINSDPVESRLAASVYEIPGHFVGRMLAAYGVDWVVAGHPHFLSVRDIRIIREECPNVLEPVTREDFARPPVVYRVSDRLECLERFLGSSGAWGGQGAVALAEGG